MSSGWGDTKTWVIGGRGYQRSTVREAMLTNERHEDCRLEWLTREPFVCWTYERDHLVTARADRNHESAVRHQLVDEGNRNLRRGGRDHDRRKRRSIGNACAAIADDDLDGVSQLRQSSLGNL